MKPSIYNKLENLTERLEELGELLSDAEIISNQNQFRELSIEYAEIKPVVDSFSAYLEANQELDNAKEMVHDSDLEIRELAHEEIAAAKAQIEQLEQALQILLLPKDPDDNRNIFLEIRAGTGGDEAAIFSGDLLRMYLRYAEQQKWQVEVISENQGEHGGYKEIITRIAGLNVYSKLKFESGAHRVQRVPETETQGRIHTSACTVAIMPEVDEVENIDINPSDLKSGYLPRIRRGWAARQQNRLRHPHHPFAQRHCCGMSGRTLAAQKPRPRHVFAASAFK